MLKRTLTRAVCPVCHAPSPFFHGPPHLAATTIQSSRLFTTSPHHNVKVLFRPTDSPELDETLADILHKIILPARLPEKQWELVHDPDRADFLQKNPVIVEVEGYEYRFPTIDFSSGDVPANRPLFWKALKLMRTQTDWVNLPSLLFGMRRSGRHFTNSDDAKMIRLAALAGHPYPIIDCALQYKRTGLRLDSPEKVLLLLAGIVTRALKAGWRDEKTWVEARRWSELVDRMVQEDVHRTPHKLLAMHRHPVAQTLVAYPLANRVLTAQRGKDADNNLRHQLEKVVTVWPKGKGLTNMHGEKAYEDREHGTAVLRDKTQTLTLGSLVVSALNMSRKALAKDPRPGDDLLAQKLLGREKVVFGEIKALFENQLVEAERGKAFFGRRIKGTGMWKEYVAYQEPTQEEQGQEVEATAVVG